MARPMFSMNLWFSRESPGISQESRENHKFMENIGLANVFHEFPLKIMENIGLANVFHEFVVFQRLSWDQPGIQEKKNSWKTLAWPMFSMHFH